MATGDHQSAADTLAAKGLHGPNGLLSIPPQRRAHLLLHNMAALSTRLFELSGSREWQNGQSKSLFPALLQGAVLPPEGAAMTSSKDLLLLLDHYQTLLFKALAEISEIQGLEYEKQRIVEAVKLKDSAMRAFAKRVRDSLQVLEATVEEFDDYRVTKRKGWGSEPNGVAPGSVGVRELVAYAHRISYTTFAPPDYAEGAPLRGALPPAPQDEQMRASKLYQVTEEDLGLRRPPEQRVSPVGVSPALGLPDVQLQGGLAPKARVPGPFPQVPPGWKPGMPLGDIPLDLLPPMPPGWKPGDPIPFPLDMPPPPRAAAKPVEVLAPAPTLTPAMVAKVEAGTPIKPPRPPAPPAAAPGVIHVPFVQLDLNPELEDEFGSDYSEDEESSDDEE